jgi:ectoine hydroxylase-related dioxygenase (phytanoyl-CoA dioxygenase family)
LPEDDVPEQQRSGLTARAVWHQDRGVGLEEFNRTHFITTWIPITRATEENGCLFVIPGSHRGAVIDHCPGGVTSFDAGVVQIPEALLPGEPVPVPMQPGDVLLLHPNLVHSSGVNRSRGIRWSFDIRFQRTGDPSGRPEWPTVAVRSRSCRRVTSYEDWRDAWLSARTRLSALNGAPLPHRWDGTLTVCG